MGAGPGGCGGRVGCSRQADGAGAQVICQQVRDSWPGLTGSGLHGCFATQN